MPVARFGGKQGQKLELVESKDLIAVRTRSQKPIGSRSNVRQPIEAELQGCELMYTFPEAGIEIYRVPTGEKKAAMESRKIALRAFADVRFAGGVLVDAGSQSPVLYTENIYVRFVDSLEAEECERITRDASLAIKEKLEFAVNAYFVQATEGTGQRIFDIANKLLDRDDVEVCHPELVRPKEHKSFFPQQWHLGSTTINGMTINQHAQVDAAHVISRGAGVTIAVIDDGVDIDHVEFSTPGKIVASLDVRTSSSDPRPRRASDEHGTACAGVACAAGIDGAAGVAPDAKLMPIRSDVNLGSVQEGKAFKWAADNGADIISCSWGPPDGDWFDANDPLHTTNWPLPDSTRDAIDYAVTRGRKGLGCVILFAAGNGNEKVDFDGYASYEKVVAVAACNDRGTRSVYSDFGKAVWCCFPSNDFGFPVTGHPEPLTTGIWTVDRRGGAGYNSGRLSDGDSQGNYTNAFGGTSSACPGAAGVCALILSVNPGLAWTEVRTILKDCCDKIDEGGGNYSADKHSDLYGYGRLNALRAVETATPANKDRIQVGRTFATAVPDQGDASVSLTVSENGILADVEVSVEIEHTYIGDLVLSLTSPGTNGRTITLQSREGGSANNLKRTYRASTQAEVAKLIGKQSGGQWTLKVQDKAARDTGTIRSFALNLTLAAPAPASPPPAPKTTRRSTKKKARA